jgi:hypothetical protein
VKVDYLVKAVQMIRINRDRFGALRTLLFVGLFAIGLAVSTAAPVLAQTPGTWAATGSMNTSRALHRAILLQNGEVLVSGGQNLSKDKLTLLASAGLCTP